MLQQTEENALPPGGERRSLPTPTFALARPTVYRLAAGYPHIFNRKLFQYHVPF